MLNRMSLYFTNFFIHLENWGAILLDPLLLTCLIFIVHDQATNAISVKKGCAHLLLLWSVTLFGKALRYQTWFNVMYVYLIILFVYCLISGRNNHPKNMICFMLLWSFYVFLTTLAKSCAGVFMEDLIGYPLTDTTVQGFIVLFTLLVLGTLMWTVKRFPLEQLGRPAPIGVIFIFIIFVLSSLAKRLIDTFVDNTQALTISRLDSRLLILFTGLLLYILAFMAYFFCFRSTKSQRENEALSSDIRRIITENAEMENRQRIIVENMEEMRSIRHDLKNQMAYMQIMLTQKDYANLEKYLAEYNRDIAASLQMPDVGNATVRNVLTLEMQKAKQNHIIIDSQITMDNPPILDTDLTAILLNLLDNAIEACIEDGATGPVISCRIRQTEAYLFIDVTNALKDTGKTERRKQLITAKDTTLHGRGTKIVRSIAEKYNGAVRYMVTDHEFTAAVMLALISI